MRKSASILISASILFVVLFDALQQKFYLDTFGLSPEGGITFGVLFANHALRWGIWLICNLLGGLYIWRSFFKDTSKEQSISWGVLVFLVLILNLAALTSIVLLNLSIYDVQLTYSTFGETFIFMIIQKGLGFTFASTLGIMLLFNISKNRLIDAQWIEIEDLKTASNSSIEANSIPNIRIKIGQRHKLIQLSDVIWFEADDYCVKIHTSSKVYSLRKSMKSLETELEAFQFIRVHRKALLNMSYFAEVDYNDYIVRLNDHSELPLSKSGATNLRDALAANSI